CSFEKLSLAVEKQPLSPEQQPCSFEKLSLAVEKQPLSPDQLLGLKTVGGVQFSPSGKEFVYYVSTPRGANEFPGGPHQRYYRGGAGGKTDDPLFPEGFRASSVRYSPDGKWLAFLHSGVTGTSQVWVMKNGGGERLQVTSEPGGVSDFRWQPGDRGIAFLTKDAVSDREKELKKRGYDFIFYEENLKKNRLILLRYDTDWNQSEKIGFNIDGHPWDFEFNQDGTMIAASVSPENLVDQRYMFRKIYLIRVASGEITPVSQNQGKLGNYAFSPDGTRLAYAAARDINDHAVSQAFIVHINNGTLTNLTPSSFKGHMEWIDWMDDQTLFCYSGEGVYPKLSALPVDGGDRTVLLDASETGVIFNYPVISEDRHHFLFTGSTPSDPSNLYYWDGRKELQRRTDLNPELQNVLLGQQEVIRYTARDGQPIEGLLIQPPDYRQGESYPLIVYVHGGPESHHNKRWLSSYSTPGQVMAGKGYLVLYLNYRASTGYGVDFGMEGFMDPAGKEFDDIADGIEWAVREKGADPDRVGMAGASYGGYASAWFATYYTRYVRAVCMFVGISDVISKRGTTDIPWEERYVHSGKPLEEQWQMNLERSPIYWAHQSRTATLIYGGAADTRVHPSQSLELYRRMKMNGHPAVRLVQYPGEGHGNRNQVGRIDVLYRQIGWLDWYVRDRHPLEGPMPPLDISEQYGLDWEF
ncbi:MAG: prolyl oligopeptidase family serine peptidase, partial [Bacteroidales bacterium]